MAALHEKKISPVVATELKSKNYIIKFTYCLKKSILKLKKKNMYKYS